MKVFKMLLLISVLIMAVICAVTQIPAYVGFPILILTCVFVVPQVAEGIVHEKI